MKNFLKTKALLFAAMMLLCGLTCAFAQSPVPEAASDWLRPNGAVLRLSPEADGTWMLVLKTAAPNANEKARQAEGHPIATGLRWDGGKNRWTGGQLRVGASGSVELIPQGPDTLTMSVKAGFMGKTETLTRATTSTPRPALKPR